MFGLEWEDDDNNSNNSTTISSNPNNDLIFNPSLLKEKLEWGDIDGSCYGVFGIPYLIESCNYYLYDTVSLLLEYNANPNITYEEGNSCLHNLIKSLVENEEKIIPLIELLINNGVDIVLLNGKYKPPFYYCPIDKLYLFKDFIHKRKQNDPEYFELSYCTFLKGIQNAFINNKYEYISFMGQFYDNFDENNYLGTLNDKYIYINCIKQNNIQGYYKLLNNNIQGINNRNKRGWSALHYAVYNNSLEIVKLLCNHPSIDINSFYNETPLHIACFKGYTDIVTYLINKNVDALQQTIFKKQNQSSNLFEYKEETALHLAIRNNHIKCAELLIKYSPSLLLIGNKYNNIPLHLAVMKGYIDSMTCLLRLKSNEQVNYKNINNQTPRDYAKKYNKHLDNILKEYISSIHRDNCCDINKKQNEEINLQWQNIQKSQKQNKQKNNRKRNKRNIKREQDKKDKEIIEQKDNNIQQDNIDEHEKFCVICMENEKNCLLKPCKHIATCIECSNIIKDCPICRSCITKRSKVFIA